MDRLAISQWLLSRVRPYTNRVLLGLATAILSGAISTVDPLLMKHLVDTVLAHGSTLGPIVNVALISLCFIARSVLDGAGGLFSFRVAQLSAQDLRVELLSHMTSLSADWQERMMLGDKLSRIEKDVEQISQFCSDVATSVVRSLVLFVVNLAIMFSMNWRITLSVLPLLPLFLWVRAHFRSRIQQRADHAQTIVGKASGNLAEHLGAVPQIQILTAETVRMNGTVEGWLDMVSAQWAQRRIEMAFSVTVTSVLAVAILTVLGFGLHECLKGALTVGGLVAFYAYATRIFGPVSIAMELYSRTQRMLASARRVREVLETQTEVPDEGTIDDTPNAIGLTLSCRGVSFAYSPSKIVLQNISMQIKSGESVALVGKSGSGKSTLSRLLPRMADPASGQIFLNETPVHTYSLRALRQAICYVPQQPVLFSGSIRANLLIADSEASDDELSRATEAAQLGDVLSRMPLGLDTLLGPDAAGLSGGERQRLAIARALLRKSTVLILDESTSALDLPTEEAVFRSLAQYRRNTAIVVISHRLRSLTWVDRMIVLDAGSIVAEGTHTCLYKECGLYRGLYETDEHVGGQESVAGAGVRLG